jgi:hypothetical protein
MLLRTDKPSRDRIDPKKQTPVRISSASVAASVLTVNFDQAVVLRGTPAFTTDIAGANPVEGSAVMTTPTTMHLSFSAPIATATEINIPFEDPAIRSAVGGFVADSLFRLAA